MALENDAPSEPIKAPGSPIRSPFHDVSFAIGAGFADAEDHGVGMDRLLGNGGGVHGFGTAALNVDIQLPEDDPGGLYVETPEVTA
jgi:hypothetical protein